MIPWNTATGIMAGGRPEQPHAPPRRPASRRRSGRPSRWEQLIPAACMNVASPAGPQPAAGRPQAGWCPAGQPAPAVQRGDQRFVMFRRPGFGPAADQRRSRRTRRRPAAGRDTASTGTCAAARPPATTTPPEARDAMPRTSRRSPRISPAPAPGQTSPAADPPLHRGLGVRQREEPVDLCPLQGALARSRASGRSCGYSCAPPGGR